MMQIHANEAEVSPQYGAGASWYANVPLAPHQITHLNVSFQNGGLLQSREIAWEPINILSGETLTIRKGDSLLLTVAPRIKRRFPQNGQEYVNIGINEETPYTLGSDETVRHKFERTGIFRIEGTYFGSDGRTESGTLTVKVVGAAFHSSPAAWVGKPRLWNSSDLPPEVIIESDSRLLLEQTAVFDNAREFRLSTDAPESRYVIARLGPEGPVLANVRVDGFRLFSASETDIEVVKTLSDGTELVEMSLVASPLVSSVSIQVDIIVGGITFDDGSVVKKLAPANFTAIGEAVVRFLRPASTKTSVCHKTKALQGPVLLGIY